MYKHIILIFVVSALQAQNFNWPRTSPEEAGLDASHIDAAIARIEANEVGNIRSLLIIKDGNLVIEKYFANNGNKRQIYSVTKSIGSTLLGIAKHQGADINLQEPFVSYLPQYSNVPNFQQVQQITLHDLLAQRHGYNWDEWKVSYGDQYNPVSQMLRTSDWYLTATQWPISHTPNQRFAYSTGHSSLMSPILHNRTGRGVYEFAQSELFDPLDISDTHWELYLGEGGMGQGITDFPHGLEPLGFGLWMKPIDLAKIGELYRLGGVWQGERLLAQEWIDLSIQRYSNGDTDSQVFSDQYSGYGYQWWSIRFIDATGRIFDAYYANGHARQFIMVFPELETVVVSTAADFEYDGPGIGSLLRENLLLAFNQNNDSIAPLTHDMNGSWFWPENSGQGINIEIINNNSQIVGYWYTYEPSGGQQRWFTFQGDINDDVAEFNIYSTTGGTFVESQPPQVSVWGQGSLKVYNCQTGLFQFNSDLESTAGEIPLTRLTASTGHCLAQNSKSTHFSGIK